MDAPHRLNMYKVISDKESFSNKLRLEKMQNQKTSFVNMFKVAKFYLFAVLLGVSATQALADPGITVTNLGPDFARADYKEETVDLEVKVMGGYAKVTRHWIEGKWQFNRPWSDLVFEYDSNDSSGNPKNIKRNGFEYARDKNNSSEVIYHYKERQSIVKTATGYRWYDRDGNWITYNETGLMLQYGDRNNVTVNVGRNADNKIDRILDHHGNQVITYAYDANGNLISATDYTNRSVSYAYTLVNNRYEISTVTDVLGYDWTYTYNVLSGETGIATRTDPEGRVINVNRILIPGGNICYNTGGFRYLEYPQNCDNLGAVSGCAPTVRYSSGRRICEVFDDTVLLKSILNSDGIGSQYKYFYNSSKKQYVLIESQSGGRIIESTFDLDGRIVRQDINSETVLELKRDGRAEILIDKNGHQTRTDYDQWKNPIKITYPDDATINRKYDPVYSNILEEVDENGIVTLYLYDTNGNLIRETQASGRADERVIEYTYDAFGNVLTETLVGDANTLESTTTYTYDDYGNVLTEIDMLGNTYAYTYDVMGNQLSVRDPRTNLWTYTYDETGNKLTTTDPFSRTATNSYNRLGELVTKTDERNNSTTYGYDNRGNVISITDALGNTTTTEYNALDLPTREIDEESKVIVVTEYDNIGRLIKSTDGNGNITEREYADTSGGGDNVISNTSRVNYPTYSKQFNYDKRGRVSIDTLFLNGDAEVTRYAYDPVGNVVGTTDRNGKNTYFEVDTYGNQIQITDALNNVTAFSYDDRDDLISFVDANTNSHSFEYDALGRLTREIRPMGQTIVYEYDAVGNIIRKITPKQQKIEYDYDVLNRQVAERHYNNVNDTTAVTTISYTYDEVGNLTNWDDGTTSGVNTFDDADRLLTQTINYGSFSLAYSYTYYRNGLTRTFTGPDAVTYSYAYDDDNQLVSVTIPGQGAITVNSYNWQAPSKVTLPGGTTRETTYNGLLNANDITVKDPAENIVAQLQYTYGRMQHVATKDSDKGNYSFNYDDVYRLVESAQTEQPDEVYTVDAVGNRIAEGASNTWLYSANNQLTSRDGYSYEYDLNGNLATKTNTNTSEITYYSYDILNRLVQVEDGTGNITARYGYDTDDKRLWKEVGGVRTYFLYSQEGLVGEYDSAGSQLVAYGYEPDTFWTTNPVFMSTGGTYYYYQNDNLGTPYKLTTSTGGVAWEAYYKTFGEVILGAANSVTNNLRFPGQYYDQETGLYYNWRRYYEAQTGRYITEDPIGLDGGYNIYAYVEHDPINKIDPTGECGIAGIAAGVAASGAIAGLTGTCFEYGIGDAILDGLCLGALSKLNKLRKLRKCSNSFSEDTLVHTEHGLEPIKNIKVGDKVLSFQEWNSEKTYEIVEAVIANEKEYDIYSIKISNGEIVESTSGHPFFVYGKGWVEASSLKIGDLLYTSDSGTVGITSVEKAKELKQVFNLTIKRTHTFFIAEKGILVHNCLSSRIGDIANKTGLTPRQVKDKIHEAKRNLPRDTGTRNPDVVVDTNTGEIYPQIPGGGTGDSIGNIFD